jgi:hypothetical protein
MITPIKYEYSKLIKNRLPYEYDNGLSMESRRILGKLFTAIIESETAIESKRTLLNSSPYFSSYDSYELIKGRFKSFISREDVNLYNYNYLFNYS